MAAITDANADDSATQPALPHQPLGRVARIMGAVKLFRPRTIARLEKTSAQLHARVDHLSKQVTVLTQTLSRQSTELDKLRAILQSDIAQAPEYAQLDAILEDASLKAHVRKAIAAAPLDLEPFPHCVVDNLLPTQYYNALIRGLPPVELFVDRPVNKQQLTVPFDLAPQYSSRVWRHMAGTVVDHVIASAVSDKFHDPLSEWLRGALPGLGERPLDRIRLSCSDGRILLRRRGYRIAPHRDPKWGFITCLLYLARPGDSQQWGTQLFSVDADEEARSASPHWIADARCRLARDVAFVANRALIFVNSVGAHGAQIPEDAEPADLQRYAYQFRIGADRRMIEAIMAELPPEQRQHWAGKISSY